MLRSILILSLWLNISFAELTIYKEFTLAKGSIEMDSKSIIVTVGEKKIELDKPADYNEMIDTVST